MNYSNVVFVFENTSLDTISPLQLEGPYKSVRYMYRRGRVLMLTPYKMRDHQYINEGRKEELLARKQDKKKKGPKSKQKITLKSAEHTMGSPKRRKNTRNLPRT
jgi:hypothetical protein